MNGAKKSCQVTVPPQQKSCVPYVFYAVQSEYQKIGTAFSMYTFSMQCNLVFIPVYHTLNNKSVKKMTGVIAIAYSLCFALYTTVGVMG
jgi:amino acid permease